VPTTDDRQKLVTQLRQIGKFSSGRLTDTDRQLMIRAADELERLSTSDYTEEELSAAGKYIPAEPREVEDERPETYDHCMALTVDDEAQRVELLLDTQPMTYSQWIEGEGADICIIRHLETNRVVGVTLPLIRRNLVVYHKGEWRLNEGFRRTIKKDQDRLVRACETYQKKLLDTTEPDMNEETDNLGKFIPGPESEPH